MKNATGKCQRGRLRLKADLKRSGSPSSGTGYERQPPPRPGHHRVPRAGPAASTTWMISCGSQGPGFISLGINAGALFMLRPSRDKVIRRLLLPTAQEPPINTYINTRYQRGRGTPRDPFHVWNSDLWYDLILGTVIICSEISQMIKFAFIVVLIC